MSPNWPLPSAQPLITSVQSDISVRRSYAAWISSVAMEILLLPLWCRLTGSHQLWTKWSTVSVCVCACVCLNESECPSLLLLGCIRSRTDARHADALLLFWHFHEGTTVGRAGASTERSMSTPPPPRFICLVYSFISFLMSFSAWIRVASEQRADTNCLGSKVVKKRIYLETEFVFSPCYTEETAAIQQLSD